MKVCVFCEIRSEDQKRLQNALPEGEFVYSPTDHDIARAEIVIGEIPPAKITLAKHLKWIQLSMAGTDPYTKTPVIPAGVTLTNATGAFGLAIAEHMIGCIYMLSKKLHLYRDHMATALWQNRGPVEQIEGATVLVIGYGDLGRTFGDKMKALGCHVIGIRRRVQLGSDGAHEMYGIDALDDLIPRADIVALTLPGTSGTEGLMTKERLFAMKKGAILVNTGRGSVLDQHALCDLLESGHLTGAALDVTVPEPLPQDHPLWKCENALITPHISGKYYLPRTYKNIISIIEANLRRYAAKEPLANVVDLSSGYCIGKGEA